MQLDPDICYRAVDARDRRFDGRFFTGVKSTGVYCRPVCPARTPLRKNCTFFACAAAAHDAGFRPCRRCRPETGPGTPVWRGTSATVDRAVRLIDEGALAQSTVPDLAARVGVGERHLRRLFAEQLGASPLAIHHTRRVHFAKRLIEQTELPHSHVALAAGFANTRRFNAAIRRTFRRTPTQIRAGAHPGPAPDGCLTLRLPVREPFDWSALLRWWAPRLIPGVEHIDGSTYRRTAQVQDFVGAIAVSQVPGRPELLLQVPVTATS